MCLRTKHMIPPRRTSTELNSIMKVFVAAEKFPTNPKLKSSRSEPKIIPLTPASGSIRFVANV